MIKARSEEKLNAQIVDEAAEWFVEFNTGEVDLAARREFDAWLRKSPEHLRAYLEMFPLWEDAPFIDPDREMSADKLIALSRAEGNVVPLEAATAPRSRASAPARCRFLLAASVLGACLIAGLLAWFQSSYRSTYATDVGEQRVIALSDGSSIELNARSRLRIRFTDTERNVDLLEGQALFRVAKDKHRPFVVRSDATRVRAVGTQFDVYRKKSGTTVTVLEGRVAVFPEPPLSRMPLPTAAHAPLIPDILVSAGEQVTVSPAAVPRATPANVAAATAWRQHRLVFSSTPLAEVAEEFNRYNDRQLIIRDTRLTTVRVNGIFSSTDPASLIRFLRAQPDITVDETDTEIRVSSK